MNNFAIKFLLSFLFFVTVSAQNNMENDTVRVRIIHSVKEVSMKFTGKWNILSDDNVIEADFDSIFVGLKDDKLFIKTRNETYQNLKIIPKSYITSVNIYNVPYGTGWWWGGKETRNYEGELRFYINNKNLIDVVIHLPIEEYLKGVIPYEIGGDSPLEALKAQAVAARSEAMIALKSGLYGGENHDLTSDVECQVFSGSKKRTVSSDKAVEETKGIVLTENNEVINAYYASNCGGHSEMIKNVWPDRPEKESYKVAERDIVIPEVIDLSDEENVKEWIFSNPESLCNVNYSKELPDWSNKYFRWEINIKNNDWEKIPETKNFGKLMEIIPLKRGESGRIYKAKFVFEQKSMIIDGELKIRQMFSPSLKSSCFVVKNTAIGFRLNGAGWGHGVGMCQSGAVALAQKGYIFGKILKHYYKKAELVKFY